MKLGKVIGIIGTRRRDTPSVRRLIEDQLWKVYEKGDIICSGGCPQGGDKFAESIAKSEGIPILIYYPNYKKFKQSAPMIRNTDIAENSDIIIACVMHPEDGVVKVLLRKEGGTEDTLRKFIKLKEQNINKVYLV